MAVHKCWAGGERTASGGFITALTLARSENLHETGLPHSLSVDDQCCNGSVVFYKDYLGRAGAGGIGGAGSAPKAIRFYNSCVYNYGVSGLLATS